MGNRFTRVTVVTDERQLDVSLPADVSLNEQFPVLLRLLSVPPAPVRWALSSPESGALNVGRSLDELGVLDGRVLFLTPVDQAASPPHVDDIELAVTQAVAVAAPTWAETRQAGVFRLMSGVLGVALLFVLVHRDDPMAWVGAAAVSVVALFLGASTSASAGWSPVWWAAPGWAFLGWLLPLTGYAQGAALVTGGALGVLLVGVVRRAALVVAAGLVSVVLGGAGSALLAMGVAGGPAAGVVLVVALVLAGLAGETGLAASRLLSLFLRDEEGLEVLQADVDARVRRGHQVATGWVVGCAGSAAVAVAATIIGAQPPPAHPELEWLVVLAGGWGAVAFAVRSRRFTRSVQVVSMLAVGLVGAAAAAISAATWWQVPESAVLLVGLALLAALLALVGTLGLGRLGTVNGARVHRLLDVVEPLLLAVLVPAVVLSFGLLPAVIDWVS